MDTKQRIAQQRVLVREAMGKIRAAEELFGAEEYTNNKVDQLADGMAALLEFQRRVDEFEKWVFEESPIA